MYKYEISPCFDLCHHGTSWVKRASWAAPVPWPDQLQGAACTSTGAQSVAGPLMPWPGGGSVDDVPSGYVKIAIENHHL